MSARIEDLEPITQELCRAFLRDTADAGHSLRVTHTRRTMDEQLHLWAQGRRWDESKQAWFIVDKSKIVTKAPPGSSPHNYGMAFDVCFIGTDPYLDTYGKTNKGPNGRPLPDPRWLQIGQIGESLGLSWGGPNGNGDRFTFDRPHFERRDWRSAAKAKAV